MQLRRSVVGMLIAGVLTFASLAQAQQAAENDTSAIETLGGFVATGVSAVTTFAEKGGVAADVTRNDFRGSGGTRNRLKNLWNARIDGWHGLSERVSKTLPYRLAPQLFQASDVLTSVVDPALAGDGRGAVSGAVDLAATTAVASAGASGGEVIGGVIGGAAGSYVPVVGNVIGRMVGGAIGNFAGGYLAPAAYSFYLKSSVTQAVEAGIAFIVDPDPLMDMIRARQQALYQQLSPEVAEMIATSQSFGGGEAQILDWQHLVTTAPPTVTPQQPVAPGDALPASFILRQSLDVDAAAQLRNCGRQGDLRRQVPPGRPASAHGYLADGRGQRQYARSRLLLCLLRLHRLQHGDDISWSRNDRS